MRFSRKQVYIAIGGAAIAFLLLAVFAIHQQISDAHDYTRANGESPPEGSPKWTDVAMVLYTFVLTAAAVGSWYIMAVQTDVLDKTNDLVEKSNTTADKALKVANDAYIHALEREVREEDAASAEIVLARIDVQGIDIRLTFRNMGRGSARTEWVAINWEDPEVGEIQRGIVPFEVFQHVLDPGDSVVFHCETPFSGEEGADEEARCEEFGSQAELAYISNGMRYRYHFAWFYRPEIGAHKVWPTEYEYRERLGRVQVQTTSQQSAG